MGVTEQVVGHEEAVKTFMQAFDRGRLHHAWLFHGPQGIGKATLCKALAHYVLIHGQTLFGEAAVRKQIAAGVYPDYIYLCKDAGAQEITVEQVRRLRQDLRVTSVTQGMRAVVIDGAEYLNRFAANSLLKMLEEPGENIVFLTLTHRLQAVLPTIRSRCCPIACLPPDAAGMERLIARDGGTADPKLLSWAQGRYGIYKRLSEQGGLALLEAVHGFMRASCEARPRTEAPATLAHAWERDAELVCELLLTWLYKMQMAHTYGTVQDFLSDAMPAHLDHRLLLPALGALVARSADRDRRTRE